MKKIPCLFEREFLGRFSSKMAFSITERITPGCEWVLQGFGAPTRKWDGTACMVKDGFLYKRYDAKKDKKTGEYRLPPAHAIPCSEPDEITGHWPHWVKVGLEPESKWHRKAMETISSVAPLEDGTYELCGPAINANPEGLPEHRFIRHGHGLLPAFPTKRTFHSLREFLTREPMEGIVFHHEDGRMCKLRRNDYGLAWPVKEA